MYKFTYKHKRTKAEDDVGHEITDVFVGQKTVFSILGFVLGGILIGESLWRILNKSLSEWYILIIGLVLFVISGIATKQFKK